MLVNLKVQKSMTIRQLVQIKSIENFILLILVMLFSNAALAENTRPLKARIFYFDIPVQKANSALALLGEQANVSFLYDYELVKDSYSGRVIGDLTVEQAVDELLKYTILKSVFKQGELFIVKKSEDELKQLSGTTTFKIPEHSGLSAKTNSATDSDDAYQLERIQISGLRNNLQKASNYKQQAKGIAEFIVSEDLGKFPDLNVAESLQRLTGIAIDRSAGEGQAITIRGFGPEFNNVLKNGRQLANDNTGRAYNFDLMATDMINGVNVLKSGIASIQEGSIGATINIISAKPFDFPDEHFVVHLKNNYETSSKASAPSGSFSLSSNQEHYGLLLAFSHLQRDLQINRIDTAGWRPKINIIPMSSGSSSNAPPSLSNSFENIYFPRNLDMSFDKQKRIRNNLNVVFQANVGENLLLTFDSYLSRLNVQSNVNALGAWLEPDRISSARLDTEDRSIIFADQVLNSAGQSGPAASDFITHNRNARDILASASGINALWQINDQLTANADLSYSTAENDRAGKERFNVIGTLNEYAFDATGEYPIVVHNKLSQGQLSSPQDARAHYNEANGFTDQDSIFEAKFDLAYQPQSQLLSMLEFGLYHQKRNKKSYQLFSAGSCLFCGYFAPVPEDLLQPVVTDNFFNQPPITFYTFDANSYLNWLASADALSIRDETFGLSPGTSAQSVGSGFTPLLQDNSYEINEKITSVYIDSTFEGDINAMAVGINLGLRYSTTTTQIRAAQTGVSDIVPTFDSLFLNTLFSAPFFSSHSNSYAQFLPSINIMLEVEKNKLLRFSTYRSLTRPTLNQLSPALTFSIPDIDSLNAEGGNPQLTPFLADNWELAAEWYFENRGLIAFTWFEKQISNFIIGSSGTEDITLSDRITTLNNVCTTCTADETSPPLVGIVQPFNVTRPRNTETAVVTGFEAAFSYYWTSGLGIQLNATFVDSNAVLTNSFDSNFALEGLGDTQNIVLIYESNRLQARLAFNNREGFLRRIDNEFNSEPIKTRAYNQVDASISYELADNISIFIEGINLTKEKLLQTGRFDNQIYSAEDTGARYSVGLSATF